MDLEGLLEKRRKRKQLISPIYNIDDQIQQSTVSTPITQQVPVQSTVYVPVQGTIPTNVPQQTIPPPVQAPVVQEPTIRPEGSQMISNQKSYIRESDIRTAIFGQSGPIKSVTLIFDATGNPTGSAVVVFYDVEDAKRAALEFDGAHIDDVPMNVKQIGSLSHPVKIEKSHVEVCICVILQFAMYFIFDYIHY